MNIDLLSQLTILFVDDDKDIVNIVEGFFNPICKKIIVAYDGEEGDEQFQNNDDIDLIITDLSMPRLSGLQFIENIRLLDSTTPIFVISAHSESERIISTINLGINGYFIKPIIFEQLIKSIEKVMETRLLRRKLEEFNHNLISQLKEQSYKLHSILDSQENMIVVTNGVRIHTANQKFLDFIGIENIESQYFTLLDLFKKFDTDNDDFFYFYNVEDAEACLNEIIHHSNDIYIKITNENRLENIFKLQITDYDCNGRNYCLSFTDITHIKKQSDAFQYKANHDQLTGILNRHYFNDMLKNEIQRAIRYKHPFTLVMFDIDHFKTINDTYGHDIGDEVLKNLTDVVSKNIRATDIFARWGGEEFMLFLPETNIEKAKSKVGLLKNSIKEAQLSTTVKETITVSFGLTELLFNDVKNSLLKRVDVALYNAKTNGRDRLEVL